MNQYTASIITAIYNIEPFLREALESVLCQDIGFEQIQLILVDDGSTDNSGLICDEYAAKYPNNILVIHKKNSGVSSARNEGMKHIRGKYVNFMDGDDMLAPNAVRIACAFLDAHGEDTDVVALPVHFFDGKLGEHVLNYKHEKGARVIDLTEEYENIHLQISSTFVKRESLVGKLFDTKLAYAEDAKILLRILLEKRTIGVAPETQYLYRQRSTGQSSAIQSSLFSSRRYLPYMHHFQHEVIRYCIQQFGTVPDFVQYTLMYDMQWRLTQDTIPENVLTQDEEVEYFRLITEAIRQFDDKIIMGQKHLSREYLFFVNALKYDTHPIPTAADNDVLFPFSANSIFKASDFPVILETLNIQNNQISLNGSLRIIPHKDIQVALNCTMNGSLHRCTILAPKTSYSLGRDVSYDYPFEVTLTLNDRELNQLGFIVAVNGIPAEIGNISCSRHFPIAVKESHSFAQRQNWLIQSAPRGISVSPAHIASLLALEARLIKDIPTKDTTNPYKAILIRCAVRCIRKLKRRPLWLIHDSCNNSNEFTKNALQALSKEHSAAKYIIVSEKDFSSKFVKPNSSLHRLVYLICDGIVASTQQSGKHIPFPEENYAFRDMITSKSLVIMNDQYTEQSFL